MSHDDTLADGETKARAFALFALVLGRKEGNKDLFQSVRWHPTPGVCDFELDPHTLGLHQTTSARGQLPPLLRLHSVKGIDDQVAQHLEDLLAIDPYMSQIPGQLGDEGYALSLGSVFNRAQRSCDHIIEAFLVSLRLMEPRKAQDLS